MDPNAKNSNRGCPPLRSGAGRHRGATGVSAIATKALHLRELGLSDRVIAQRLGVFPDFQESLPDDFDL